MTEERGDRVAIGRTPDGMIFVVMPPVVVAATFLLLSGTHVSMTCEFVNGLAYHMKDEAILKTGLATPRFIDEVLAAVAQRHKKSVFIETHVKAGSPEEFDGMYYAIIHPTELAGVGEVMREILDRAPSEFRDAPVVTGVLEMWAEAASRFVSTTEALALLGSEGTA